MKKIVSLLIIMLICFTLKAEKFIVGVEDINYYPHFAYADNNYKGYAKDILDLFAQKKGYTFEYKALPVKRLFNALIENKIDFKYPDNPLWNSNLKKNKNITYTNGITNFTDGVFVIPKRKGKGINHLKRLGVVRGFTPFDYLNDIKAGKITTVENSKFEAMLKQALRNRSDGVYGNTEVIKYVLEHKLNKKGALVFDDKLPHSNGKYYLSSGKRPKIIKEFNQFLIDNKNEIEKIKMKYNLK